MAQSANDVVVIGGYRTAFSKYGGTLREWSSAEIAAHLLPRALERLHLDPNRIDYMIGAAAAQMEVANSGNIVTRQVLVRAKLPLTIPSLTVDQASCSGLTAVQLARQTIIAGDADVTVAFGTEALGNTPFFLPPALRWKGTRLDITARDPLFPIRLAVRPQGVIGEVDAEASAYGVTRDDMDRWALASQQRFEAARQQGFCEGEIIPVDMPDGSVYAADEQPKPWTTIEKLQALKTVFGSKTVTAGNSPGLETGAAMVVLMRRRAAQSLGYVPLASLPVSSSLAGDLDEPLVQGARATHQILERTGHSIRDIDLFEIEEDFAAVVPISARYWEKHLAADYDAILERTNVNGGAVAVGHPFAAGGVRIVVTLVREMARRRARLGVAAISGGLSQGAAVLVASEQT